MSRDRRHPDARLSLVSWLNGLKTPRGPFTDSEGRKGWLAPFAHAPPHRVTRYALPLAGVRGRPWQVAVLADLHVGSHTDDRARLRHIVADTNALAPDLVLLLGDYVNMAPFGGGRVPPEAVAEDLAGVQAPAFAVLGNHDWKYGRNAIVSALAHHGIEVVENRIALATRDDGEWLAVLGLEDDNYGEPDLALLARLPSELPHLVATHNPGLLHDIPPGHLVVAGHMHGGQIRVPGLPPPVVPSGRAPRRWAGGVVQERGSTLVVSVGLGTSGIPVRLGAPPEIVLLTLGGAP